MNRNIKIDGEDWVIVHSTSDEWEARLIKTALLNEKIRCRMRHARRADGRAQWVITVLSSKQLDALEVASRVEWAIAAGNEAAASSKLTNSEGETKSTPPEQTDERVKDTVENQEDNIVQVNLEAVQQELIAKREGIGEIIHYPGVGYELRVGPKPYYMVNEERWEEFIDFSAQRQEFSILLRGEYKRLFKWLKEEKLMAEFIRLIESTYREVPIPKLKNRRKKAKKRKDNQSSSWLSRLLKRQ